LLCASSITVWCSELGIQATVAGDHGTYHLRVWPDRWSCPCPARTKSCAHVLAVEAVTGWKH
jgi:hypothetical protein